MAAESMSEQNYVLRVLELFEKYGEREALALGDQRLTYAQLRARTLALAEELRRQGVREGMAVAVLIRLPIEGPALQLAIHLLGCRLIHMVLGSSPQELLRYLTVAKPDVLVYDPGTVAPLAEELLTELGDLPVLCLGPDGAGPDLLAGEPSTADPLALAGAEPESVFQTSGSTGTPKALLHRNHCFAQSVVLGERWEPAGHPRLRHLSVTPLWWSAGTVATMITLCGGGFIMIQEGWDSATFLAAVQQYEINYTFMSSAMFYQVLDDPALAETDTSSLYMLNIGAAPASPERLRQGIERLGPVVRIAYGLSESPYISAIAGLTADSPRLTSCGLPWGDVRVEIRGEDGRLLGPGETGEIWVASALNFAGYLGQPELTEQSLVDGWLRTRDLGYRDEEGYLYIGGRAQDMIITGVGARKIFAGPIENVLAEHPQIRAAAVIGVPDPAFVEVVHAYVVPDGDISEEELRALVSAQLPEICVPRTVDFVDSLPLIGIGKVDKNALRARYAAEHQPAAV
jgi:fatty-acyl-CoA synthase